SRCGQARAPPLCRRHRQLSARRQPATHRRRDREDARTRTLRRDTVVRQLQSGAAVLRRARAAPAPAGGPAHRRRSNLARVDQESTMKLLSLAVAALSTLALVPPARAESYPARTIRMIVPYPAGGTSDVLARVLAK